MACWAERLVEKIVKISCRQPKPDRQLVEKLTADGDGGVEGSSPPPHVPLLLWYRPWRVSFPFPRAYIQCLIKDASQFPYSTFFSKPSALTARSSKQGITKCSTRSSLRGDNQNIFFLHKEIAFKFFLPEEFIQASNTIVGSASSFDFPHSQARTVGHIACKVF